MPACSRDVSPRSRGLERHRHRRQGVIDVVPPQQRQDRLLARVASHDLKRRALRSALFDGVGADVGGMLQRVAHHPPVEVAAELRHVLIVRVQHRGASPGKPGDQLILGARDLRHRVEESQVHGRDVGHQAQVGLRDARQRRNLSGMRHGKLHHCHLVLRLQAQQLQRQAKVIVQVALGFHHAVAPGEKVGDGVLGGGLAGGAGHRDQRLAPGAADRGAQLLQGQQRVVHCQQLGADGFGIAGELLVADDGRHRAPLQRRFHEVVPVQALATHGEEQLARRQSARINGVAGGDGLAVHGSRGREQLRNALERELHGLAPLDAGAAAAMSAL